MNPENLAPGYKLFQMLNSIENVISTTYKNLSAEIYVFFSVSELSVVVLIAEVNVKLPIIFFTFLSMRRVEQFSQPSIKVSVKVRLNQTSLATVNNY